MMLPADPLTPLATLATLSPKGGRGLIVKSYAGQDTSVRPQCTPPRTANDNGPRIKDVLLKLIQSHHKCFRGEAGLAQLLGELPGALLSGFVTYAYSVVEAIAAIEALDDDGVKARAD